MTGPPSGSAEQNPPAAFPPGPDETNAPTTPIPDGGTSELLLRLLRLRPLTSLYRETAEKHRPIREWICFWGDALLLLVIYGILLIIIGTVAVKVLSPIPDLWPF